VGDILEVRNNEQIPADLIILASALPQNSAYIETANIDGESNLKLKVAAGVGGQSLSGPSSSSSSGSIGSDDSQRKAQLFKRSEYYGVSFG
jgi:P-type E1-E2 ATPase